MFNLILTDLGIICRKKGFQVSFILVTAYAFFVSLYYAYFQKGMDVSNLYHPAILSGINADANFTYLFCKYYPFIVVMPAAFVLLNERKTQIFVFTQSRTGIYKYYFSKLAAGFIASFIVFTVPFLIELLLNIIIFPLEATKSITNWATYSPTYFEYASSYFFGDLFLKNTYLYYICTIILLGIFSGCATVFLMGISSFPIKFKAFMFLPVYLFFYITNLVGGAVTDFPTTIDFYITAYDSVPGKRIEYYLLLMMLLLVSGIICTCISIRNARKSC